MTTPAARLVILGIDGSDVSIAALRWTADEARRRSAPLWVVQGFDLVRAEYFALAGPRFIAADRRAAEERA